MQVLCSVINNYKIKSKFVTFFQFKPKFPISSTICILDVLHMFQDKYISILYDILLNIIIMVVHFRNLKFAFFKNGFFVKFDCLACIIDTDF